MINSSSNEIKTILELLERQGKTQKELAVAIGVSEGTVLRWKNGKSITFLSPKYLNKIASFLRVPASYIGSCNVRLNSAAHVSICIDCIYSVGLCPWSSQFKPIKGWKAEKTTFKDKNNKIKRGYRVISCPEFIPEKEHEERNIILSAFRNKF